MPSGDSHERSGGAAGNPPATADTGGPARVGGAAAASGTSAGPALTAGQDLYSAGQNMVIDHSRHEHYGTGSDRIPLIRRITDEDVTGFVGRDDELKWLAERLYRHAPPGGPLLLCPQDDQAKIGVTSLALQAASRALAAGWFPGGAVLVTPHPGDKERDIDLGATMTEVLAQLGVLAGRRGVGPADYQDAMDGLAAQGRPVLIVIENVWESDASLVLGLRLASRPHRMLMTAWQPRNWMNSPRRLDVRYLTEDESVEVLATTLAAEHGGVVDAHGPPACPGPWPRWSSRCARSGGPSPTSAGLARR